MSIENVNIYSKQRKERQQQSIKHFTEEKKIKRHELNWNSNRDGNGDGDGDGMMGSAPVDNFW